MNVLTYQYDNSRAGQNLREPLLTPASVNSSQFGKRFSHAVDGYIYGQLLYVANVSIPGSGVHNVVYAATEHDSVYAFDADNNAGANAAPLWHVNFLNAASGVTSVPYQDTGCSQITPEIGITSTPVIDPAAGTIYVVAMTREASAGAVNYVHRLHALDLTTGAERTGSPVVIQAFSFGAADGGAVVTFQPKNYKQRPGLLLLNGIVYTAWSSHCDIGLYHGWLIAYDARTLRQVAVYNNTVNGNEGSFWASGAGPAADANGFIYLVAGNGTFDAASGGPDLGNSYIKLSTANGLSVSDYFAPFNVNELNAADADVGSSGVALLPDEAGSTAHPHLMVGAGKEGRIYLLDRDHMGGYQSGSDSQIVQSLAGGLAGGLFGNSAYFNHTVYFAAVGDTLKAFGITNGQLTTSPVSRSAASFGYPGGVPTISASGAANGIVWLLEGAPRLHAYDAANLGHELYHSDQAGDRDRLSSYVKFSVPTVANGKVYAGMQDSMSVFGLLSSPQVANLASGQGGVAPGSIMAIGGAGLAASNAPAGALPLPLELAGVSVSIDGVPAPLFMVSPTQIYAQVPQEAAPGNATVRIDPAGLSFAITIQATAPGLFTMASNRAAVANEDGTANGPGNPARAGSFVAAFLTGLGATDPPVPNGAAAAASPLSVVKAQVSATIGGQPAEVVFAGLAPGFAGLFQVNLRVPALAQGDYPLIVSAANVPSNSAVVSVR